MAIEVDPKEVMKQKEDQQEEESRDKIFAYLIIGGTAALLLGAGIGIYSMYSNHKEPVEEIIANNTSKINNKTYYKKDSISYNVSTYNTTYNNSSNIKEIYNIDKKRDTKIIVNYDTTTELLDSATFGLQQVIDHITGEMDAIKSNKIRIEDSYLKIGKYNIPYYDDPSKLEDLNKYSTIWAFVEEIENNTAKAAAIIGYNNETMEIFEIRKDGSAIRYLVPGISKIENVVVSNDIDSKRKIALETEYEILYKALSKPYVTNMVEVLPSDVGITIVGYNGDPTKPNSYNTISLPIGPNIKEKMYKFLESYAKYEFNNTKDEVKLLPNTKGEYGYIKTPLFYNPSGEGVLLVLDGNKLDAAMAFDKNKVEIYKIQ